MRHRDRSAGALTAFCIAAKRSHWHTQCGPKATSRQQPARGIQAPSVLTTTIMVQTSIKGTSTGAICPSLVKSSLRNISYLYDIGPCRSHSEHALTSSSVVDHRVFGEASNV
ncbi:hypothetical protein BD311DRAFT_103845 [Dichomitus squalens]|uniref:Uncharacterized protein n=1 Tax=Dichomitus squalens TaxID=114155 RepID=A0A4Q9MUV4_9APHY|nr:hypothetical protein BD311DRAFT_103845 [Dichomitus squalens]